MSSIRVFMGALVCLALGCGAQADGEQPGSQTGASLDGDAAAGGLCQQDRCSTFYPSNLVYDPSGAREGCCCVTTSGRDGALVKLAFYPTRLICMAGATPRY